MKLNQISDNPQARKDRKRIGRGIGSGTGKTSGAGHKGQKARSGVALKGFEGGQMPLNRRLPKRGFKNIFAKDFAIVNLSRLQTAIDAGKLDPKKPVDLAALQAAGVINKPRDGVRLLAKGELKAKVDITVVGASKAAVAAVEKAGGSLTVSQPAAAAKDATAKKAATAKARGRVNKEE
jgi:large subunit ribosomal protein L15